MDTIDLEEFPSLLTQGEAVKALRLDEADVKDPKESLRYLRRTRQIGYVKVARRILIPRDEIRRYLKEHTVEALS